MSDRFKKTPRSGAFLPASFYSIDETTGQPVDPDPSDQGADIVLLHFGADFTQGAGMPVSGDAFELVPNQLTPRFKANGLFGYDTNVGDALQAILDNCDGTFIQADGKIKLVIPRKLTAAELADLDNQDILTDKGANATIIRRGGKSTLRWVPKPLDQAPNEIWYEFTDRDSDFENKRLAIRLDDAQAALGAVYSEPRRDIQSETLSLGLTNTRDQGARIATRRIRRNGMILGGWRNGRLEMEVPIHVAGSGADSEGDWR